MIRYFLASFAGAAVVILALALWLALWSPAHASSCFTAVASHYGAESGNRTADGSYFDGSQMIVAHRTMKFGEKLRVTYKGKSVVVTVRDRGPYVRGRSLDISTAAARKIGLTKVGVGKVTACHIG